jgi:hypothetical protein
MGWRKETFRSRSNGVTALKLVNTKAIKDDADIERLASAIPAVPEEDGDKRDQFFRQIKYKNRPCSLTIDLILRFLGFSRCNGRLCVYLWLFFTRGS